jgi:hypothetical protein
VHYVFTSHCSHDYLCFQHFRINALSLLIALIAIADASDEKNELEAKLSLIFDAFDFSHKGLVSMEETVCLRFL